MPVQVIGHHEFHLRVQLLHLVRQRPQPEAWHYYQFRKLHQDQQDGSIRHQHFENLKPHLMGFHTLFHFQGLLEPSELLGHL